MSIDRGTLQSRVEKIGAYYDRLYYGGGIKIDVNASSNGPGSMKKSCYGPVRDRDRVRYGQVQSPRYTYGRTMRRILECMNHW